MPANILVIAVDGLRASSLGAYGNTAYGTPALDRFAAESLLFDWHYATSPELIDVYRALWYSFDPAQSRRNTGGEGGAMATVSLPRMFADRGYATTLITDELLLSSIDEATEFQQAVQTACERKVMEERRRTNDPAQTELAHIFGAAIDAVDHRTPNEPRLIWLHARGMYGDWDAPIEFQESLLDEDDPPPIESSAPPDLAHQSNDDPDAAFRYTCAYAAQVMVLDTCIENILATIDAVRDEWLVMLIGARGFPLGEHGRIGGVDPRLFVEQLHVPWLVRLPNNVGRLSRSSALTSHADVLPTLVDWNGSSDLPGNPTFDGTSVLPLASSIRVPWRDAIIATSTSASAIRTPAWCLRIGQAAGDTANSSIESSATPELYVRPDDRWEANDVAKLCPDVVDELRAKMTDVV